jgi:hypothetical protein
VGKRAENDRLPPAEGLAEQRSAIVAVTAQERQPVGRHDRDQAVSVVLDLVQPVVAVRDLGAGRDDLKASRGISAAPPCGAMGTSTLGTGK